MLFPQHGTHQNKGANKNLMPVVNANLSLINMTCANHSAPSGGKRIQVVCNFYRMTRPSTSLTFMDSSIVDIIHTTG